MTLLETYLQSSSLSEVEAMDLLQDDGIISDLCVWAKDVAEADQPAAVKFLQETTWT